MTQLSLICLGMALLAPLAPRPAGPDKKAVEALLNKLKSSEPREQSQAAAALGKLGPGSNDAVPLLIKVLRERDDHLVAPVAAQALAGIGAAAVADLAETLKEKDVRVQRLAAGALKRIGPAAVAAVPALVDVAKSDRDLLTRAEAIDALGHIGPKAKGAVPALLLLTRGAPRIPLAQHAITALGRIGPDAREAVPELIKIVKERGKIAGAQANLYLPCRLQAAEALGRIGSDARDAIPALQDFQKEKIGPATRVAGQALEKIQAKK